MEKQELMALVDYSEGHEVELSMRPLGDLLLVGAKKGSETRTVGAYNESRVKGIQDSVGEFANLVIESPTKVYLTHFEWSKEYEGPRRKIRPTELKISYSKDNFNQNMLALIDALYFDPQTQQSISNMALEFRQETYGKLSQSP